MATASERRTLIPPFPTTQTPRAGLSRGTTALAILDGFVGLTAALGAVFIVPSLRIDDLRYGSDIGLTVPSVVLGLIAVLSLAGLGGLLLRRPSGGRLSLAAGVLLVLYELLESFGAGNILIPQPGVASSVVLAVWLRPVYILIGLAMLILGGRVARVLAGRPPGRGFRGSGVPATVTSIVLIVLTLAMTATYGWAASSTDTSMYARFLWGPGTTYDWTRFPSRPLPPAASPHYFVSAPVHVNLTRATGSSNPDAFFTSSETTALLAIHNGRLVLERYFNGATRSTRILAFSDSKSWDATLLGQAIASGAIHSINDRVTRYIPELARRDPRFATMTLRDLVDMRSGLGWDTSGLLVNDDTVVYHTPALRQAVLSRVKIVTPPGRTFRYNDFNPLLLGIVLERATGQTVTQYLDHTLWGPLGAQNPGSFMIDSTTGGFEKMESGLAGTPIDLIRLGVLYLHDGAWKGHQLVPKQWIATSTDYASASPTRFSGVRYRQGWWMQVINGTPVYYAWGDHGEYVLVAPSLHTVVARFGRQYGLGSPSGDSSGGTAGVRTWPTVLTRIAQSVAATRS